MSMKTVRISLGETEHQEQHYDPHGMDLKIGEQVVVERMVGQQVLIQAFLVRLEVACAKICRP